MTRHSETHPISATGAVLLAGCLLVAPGLVQADDDTEAAAVDLSGAWELDRDASDDAREKMRDIMEAPGGPGGPGGGGMPGGGAPPGGAPPGGPPPGGMGGPDPREAMKTLFEPAEEITIRQSAPEVEIEETFGELWRFRPNGKTYKTDNGLSETKAEWKDGALRVETKPARGQKRVETWSLSPDGRRLTMRLEIEGGRMPDVTLTRVYNRSGDASPEPDPR